MRKHQSPLRRHRRSAGSTLAATALAITSITGGGAATAQPTAAGSAPVAPAQAAQPAPAAPAAQAEGLSALVNPFVGTSSEGNAYPGATAPFGMVQLSPDNANSYGNTSYSPDNRWVWGFSHRHINSAGCPAAGEILVEPSAADSPITAREQIAMVDGSEAAHAGYYTVQLEGGVTAELTTTERVGVHRYEFADSDTGHLSLNVGETLRDAGSSEVAWVDDQTLEGFVENGGFCGGTSTTEKVFFSAHFDRPADSTGTWDGSGTYTEESPSSVSDGGQNGAVATFDTTTDQDVEIAVGISFVDVDGARANRTSETSDDTLTFAQARAAAEAGWDDQLGAATITASNDARIIFYTQLYKALLSPTIGSDVDGRYRGMDKAVHTAEGWTYHQTFSLWDTYRTQATLHALVARDHATDIVRSMYQQRVEGGWFPRWSLGSIETNIMAGDPASAWVAENFTMGTVPDDIADPMWDYLVENATTPTPGDVASVGRQSADFYNQNHHIPFYFENEPGLGQEYEEYRHGGSSSMEFAISDAAIGAAAQRSGRPEAAEFLERGQWWRTLWNPDVELSGDYQGIVNAVFPDGSFNVRSNEKDDVTKSGFHEGTQWQYQWMASQDYAGLQEVMGGTDEFLDRLDYYFDMPALLENPGQSPSHWAKGGSDYYSSIGYNPGNEPTIMNPWLYSSAGHPAYVNDVLASNLNRFPNTPGGGVGNDDLGTMASWYVMVTLGFEPVVPGSGMMALNSPRVEAASLRLGPDADSPVLQINASGSHESMPRYIESVAVNGTDHSATWFDVEDILSGGTLDFTLTQDRDTPWGTSRADRLPSVSDPVQVKASATAGSPEFQSGVETTNVVGKVEFEELTKIADDAVTFPTVSATFTADGTEYEALPEATDNGWEFSVTAEFAKAGNLSGTLSVSAGEDTPKFAPETFEPVSVEVPVKVLGADPTDDPSEPGTDPSDNPSDGGSGEPGTGPSTSAPDPSESGGTVGAGDAGGSGNADGSGGDAGLPNTGAKVAGIVAAALLLTAAGTVLVARRRKQN